MLLKISPYEANIGTDMHEFQDIHWVLWAWMSCLVTNSKISLVSVYSPLIMFQVLKPNFLSFNEMYPNVTPTDKWQRKSMLLDTGRWWWRTVRWQLYNIKLKKGVLNPKWRGSVFFECKNRVSVLQKKGDILTVSRILFFSFSKGIFQEHIVQQKTLPGWDCSSSRPELFLILFSALLVLNKWAAVFQQW